MSAATMNEMDRLVRERDEARAERDALAASVERLRGYLVGYSQMLKREATNQPDNDAGDHLERRYLDEAKRVDLLYNSKPETSLACLKAQWQAEVLEERANWALCRTDERKLLKAAAELRRQAQDPTND